MLRLVVLAACCLLALPARAQETTGPIRLYLDCQNIYDGACDYDYFRTEVAFVDYVRNREDSDVHVILTSQENGSGGETYTLRFIGLRRFGGVEDVLAVATSQTDTQDERRGALVQALKAGLVRYLARTDALERLTVSYAAPASAAAETAPERDPWNYWVFRSSLQGFFNGEQRYKSAYVSGSLSAQRTTEAWKTEGRVFYNLSRDEFEIDDSTTTVDLTRSYGTRSLLVRSLGDHWSVGGQANSYFSDYDNTALSLRAAPAVEYSVFPYSESTRRALRLLYTVGVTAIDYQQETIFFKTSEVLFDHELEAGLEYQQPWGSLELSLGGTQYLHDLSRYRVRLDGEAEVRLARGLSLRFNGNISRIRNQLGLARGDASAEDVLLRRRALGTNYRYFLSVGLSYTFGSIFNNVVNPRFD